MTRARRRWAWMGGTAAAVGFVAWLRCGTLPPSLLDADAQVSTQVVARDGEPLRESLSADGQRNRRLDPRRLPDTLARATLAAEDARFFRHPGLDPLAIARAVVHDVAARRLVEGGSTLTQQAVKILIRRERTAV
jgi:penicillin-binding protein 1C